MFRRNTHPMTIRLANFHRLADVHSISSRFLKSKTQIAFFSNP